LNSNILQDSKTLKFSKEQSNTKSSNKEAKEKKNNKKIKKNIYILLSFLCLFSISFFSQNAFSFVRPVECFALQQIVT
jgi:uncharacterized protein YqhQ